MCDLDCTERTINALPCPHLAERRARVRTYRHESRQWSARITSAYLLTSALIAKHTRLAAWQQHPLKGILFMKECGSL